MYKRISVNGYSNLDGAPVATSTTTWILAICLAIALAGIVLVGSLMGVFYRAPCTKTCGDLSIDCSEYCVTDIIIGGGTTGLSLANALSANATRNVLVFEAGGNHVNDPLVTDPRDGLWFESLYLEEPYRFHYDLLTTIQFDIDQMHARAGRIWEDLVRLMTRFCSRDRRDFGTNSKRGQAARAVLTVPQFTRFSRALNG